MKQIAFFPFPYITSDSAVLNAGSVFAPPTFCRRNHNSHICKHFYRNINTQIEHHEICPYGFCVDVVKIDNSTTIFTALNVEKWSNRKDIQKRLSDKDFLPKLSIGVYQKIKENAMVLHRDSTDYFRDRHAEETKKNVYLDKIEGLDNTFHELRKLNKQLKSQVEFLIFQSDSLRVDDGAIGKIKYLSKNILSSSQLITIRLNTYDFTVNPELSSQEVKRKIPVHKKFVKVSHNLREYAKNKHLLINITGQSLGCIMGNDVFELLPYLLLDNAIKYSLPRRNIDVRFVEDSSRLIVSVKSFSIRPNKNELMNLKTRGVRGRNTESVQGQGIGLYIADMICQTHNIDLTFKLGDECFYDHANNDIAYSDFQAILTFNSFEYVDTEEYRYEE